MSITRLVFPKPLLLELGPSLLTSQAISVAFVLLDTLLISTTSRAPFWTITVVVATLSGVPILPILLIPCGETPIDCRSTVAYLAICYFAIFELLRPILGSVPAERGSGVC